ncbi:AP180 N-terminal homology domain-containing protein [Radiomyces spectabilis]|uniref:AP180 N-terminal homology domain-containing protein n=1 Tax=Radiomyces spectabilis TaxID=64574 RepID=UPI00221ED719|nr:AP180 N-terminal homology domain-containing protein [Radiomyces spectabilis]KAI8372995.1 AP180 N-terminal homology domain-containing protein [Radiomyces spectabilis]
METALRKATRLDYNPPKQKHLSALISMTFHHPGMVTDMMDILSKRLRENSWIISFKVLIIIHSLMRDGNGDRAIAYAEAHPSSLDTSRLREKSSGLVHIENIHNYTSYLIQRVHAYRELKMDYIKATTVNKVSRLRRLTVAQGLLRDLPVLQKQIGALLRCKFHMDDVDNTISLYAFRLLVEDMLVLFQTVNEGVVNILEQYFTMSQTDARAALEIYKRFSRQTEDTIAFMATARHLQHEMHMTIPVPKHVSDKAWYSIIVSKYLVG